MQHIVHIFIGNELSSFKDLFASTFRQLHADVESPFFTAVSLTIDETNRFIFKPDINGDTLDGKTIDKDNLQPGLFNFFEDMYGRKVTIEHPGNRSLIVYIWALLYSENVYEVIAELVNAVNSCESNLTVEVLGFTNNAVSCFIPESHNRLASDVYKNHFDNNITNLRNIRQSLSGFQLIANRNIDNVALNLNKTTMSRICAEYSALMCNHYLSVRPNTIDSADYPFESFGVSSVIFDLEYFKTYILNRLITDKAEQQSITNRSFNINGLANKTNPILKEIVEEIHQFYNTQVTNAKGILSLTNNANASNIVGRVDSDIKDIITKLRTKVNDLLATGEISIFEREALLSLLLGDDCAMFASSAVDANEILIDDIIEYSAKYFINIDSNKAFLKDVSLSDIKAIRTKMRNIAVTNRERETRIRTLDVQQKDAEFIQNHIDGNEYRFGGIDYKINLNIDEEPLEQTYTSHDVTAESIDLRNFFAPIRNQGTQGSCASFAISSVIESLRHDKKTYSPAFLYWSARESQGSTESDSGESLYSVIKAAMEKGVCAEEYMPYNSEIYTVAPSETAIKSAMDCHILEAKTVEPKLRDIKSALSDGFPVIIVSKIFDSFSETMSGFVRHPSPEELSSGERTDGHGNHAMVVCGYSDKERILVVRNSWGKEFGDNGYCYIPYSYAQQYFLQACIITKVTSSNNSTNSVNEQKTINFNTADANIETAILQNLINEDRFELVELENLSKELKKDWTLNIATLGNVNKQAEIIEQYNDKLDNRIKKEENIIANLQSSKAEKTKVFKRNYIIRLTAIGILSLISWIVVYYLANYTLPWIIASVVSLVFFTIFCAFRYKWRKYRQDLRDEIQEHATTISTIQEEKASLGVKAHIHGKIIKEAEAYKTLLSQQAMKYHKYNDSFVRIYDKATDELRSMSPTVPYPFLAILENDLLDCYYSMWKEQMLNSISIDSTFKEYTLEADLNTIIQSNTNLNNIITRGLRGFSMKEILRQEDQNRWQFIPNSERIAGIIPEIDNRAKPFCYFRPTNGVAYEKYIFFTDAGLEDMNNISRYFDLQPTPINLNNPYYIYILNIVHYNIE